MSEKDLLTEGPGAASAANEIPLIEVEHTGHTLEPEGKRLPIGPDNILYPVLVGIALFPILMGSAGHHLADDMPDDETHPFFPDHFWPYPVIIIFMMLALGLLAFFVQKNLQLEQSADPRARRFWSERGQEAGLEEVAGARPEHLHRHGFRGIPRDHRAARSVGARRPELLPAVVHRSGLRSVARR